MPRFSRHKTAAKRGGAPSSRPSTLMPSRSGMPRSRAFRTPWSSLFHPKQSGAMPDLDRLQRWFQAVIMHPDGVIPGVLGPDARQHMELSPGELERVVTRSKSLTAGERVAIYGRSYHARLTECLEVEFRVLRQAPTCSPARTYRTARRKATRWPSWERAFPAICMTLDRLRALTGKKKCG